jgi:hypothetical protein
MRKLFEEKLVILTDKGVAAQRLLETVVGRYKSVATMLRRVPGVKERDG